MEENDNPEIRVNASFLINIYFYGLAIASVVGYVYIERIKNFERFALNEKERTSQVLKCTVA